MRAQLPTLGVPRRIPAADAPFVVVAGIGLTIVSIALILAMVDSLGLATGRENLRLGIFVAGLVIGPTAAYFIGVWLRTRLVSRMVGCAGLAAWSFAISFVAAVAGWIGAALMVLVPAALMWRVRPRLAPTAHPAGLALPGSGYPGELPARPIEAREPAKPDRDWGSIAGTVLGIGIVVAYFLFSGGGAGSGTIAFGSGVDKETGKVTGEASVFHPGEYLAWSASLTDTADTSDLRLRVTVVAGNDKSVETTPLEAEEGEADVVFVTESIPVTGEMIGSYTLEVVRAEEVLATGQFTVEAR